jgi:hypothetical protein
MKWLKERDELIAQTEAFVKSVTARRPEAAAITKSTVGPTAPIENPFTPIAARPAPPVSPPAPPAKLVPAQPVSMERVAPAQPTAPVELPEAALPRAEPAPMIDFAEGEVRQEIQSRVAAFRANQHRFQREREAYYNAVLTRARSTGRDTSDNSSS